MAGWRPPWLLVPVALLLAAGPSSAAPGGERRPAAGPVSLHLRGGAEAPAAGAAKAGDKEDKPDTKLPKFKGLKAIAQKALPEEWAAAAVASLMALRSVHTHIHDSFQQMPANSCMAYFALLGVFCWTMCTVYWQAFDPMLDQLGPWTAFSGLFATCVLILSPLFLFVPEQKKAKAQAKRVVGESVHMEVESCFDRLKTWFLRMYLLLMIIQVGSACSIFQLMLFKQKAMRKSVRQFNGTMGNEEGDGAQDLQQMMRPYLITLLYLLLAWCSLCVVYERVTRGNFGEDFPHKLLADAFPCLPAERMQDRWSTLAGRTSELSRKLSGARNASAFARKLPKLFDEAVYDMRSVVRPLSASFCEMLKGYVFQLRKEAEQLGVLDVRIRLARCLREFRLAAVEAVGQSEPLRSFQAELDKAAAVLATLPVLNQADLPSPGCMQRYAQEEIHRRFAGRTMMRSIALALQGTKYNTLGLFIDPLTPPSELYQFHSKGDVPRVCGAVSVLDTSECASGVEEVSEAALSRLVDTVAAVPRPALDALAFSAKMVDGGLADLEQLSSSLVGLAGQFGAHGRSIMEAAGPLFLDLPAPLFLLHWALYQLFALHALGVTALLELRLLRSVEPCLAGIVYGSFALLLIVLCLTWAFWATMGVLHDPPRRRADDDMTAMEAPAFLPDEKPSTGVEYQPIPGQPDLDEHQHKENRPAADWVGSAQDNNVVRPQSLHGDGAEGPKAKRRQDEHSEKRDDNVPAGWPAPAPAPTTPPARPSSAAGWYSSSSEVRPSSATSSNMPAMKSEQTADRLPEAEMAFILEYEAHMREIELLDMEGPFLGNGMLPGMAGETNRGVEDELAAQEAASEAADRARLEEERAKRRKLLCGVLVASLVLAEVLLLAYKLRQ